LALRARFAAAGPGQLGRGPVSTVWEAQPERSTPRTIRLVIWLALHFGRAFTRVLLIPIVAYFVMTGGEPGRASHRFLRHALGREPSLADRARHWYAYAAVLLDRVFLLSDHGDAFAVEVEHRQAAFAFARQRGALILVSHFGSFDVMRVAGQREHLPLRIVLNRQQGGMLTQLLETLNPALAAGVIDASQRGPQLVLALKQALDQGDLLGVMGDRAYVGERTVTIRFMDRPAQLPESPWILASALKVPVIVAFGIYLGGNRYRLHFDMLTERVVLPRTDRSAVVQGYAQAYANRLEAQVRKAPYNWFNFYDFWTDETAAR
jgi:predicted LPLAT superfamily acyltransferase